MTWSTIIYVGNRYTANLFTAKIAGFHCVHFPTALSLYFWHSVNACSGSLHSNWGAGKTCVYCGEKPAIFTTFPLQFLQLFHSNFMVLFYCIFSRKNVVDQPGNRTRDLQHGNLTLYQLIYEDLIENLGVNRCLCIS